MNAVYRNYLDTSALIKLFVNENGSVALRTYCDAPTPCFTSSLCLGEALGYLKRKAKKPHGRIRDPAYYHFCSDLTARVSQGLIKVKDVGIQKWEIFSEVLGLAKDNSLDIADAFLIVTLEKELFPKSATPSRSLLITADKDQARVARARGLDVWDCARDNVRQPPNLADFEIAPLH